jgi:preprotein translocase subunit SecA
MVLSNGFFARLWNMAAAGSHRYRRVSSKTDLPDPYRGHKIRNKPYPQVQTVGKFVAGWHIIEDGTLRAPVPMIVVGSAGRPHVPDFQRERPLGAIPTGFRAKLQALTSGPSKRRLAQWSMQLPAIAAMEPELQKLSDGELRKKSLALRYRAKSQEPLERIMPEAFALVREAGRRTINMRHFDVQLVGGMALNDRSIVEMQTGEGKTLVATLPLYLNCLSGKGAHLATVNDYLARRDAEWMRPIYEILGLTMGVVEESTSRADRIKAYASDITYGTSKEFGFDFLKDRILLRGIGEGSNDFLGAMLGRTNNSSNEQPVQRAAHFALVDEADSILIDEARTPMIIAAIPTDKERVAVACYRWSADVYSQFELDRHYKYEHEEQKVELTSAGRHLIRKLAKPPEMDAVGMFTIYEYIERAIKVELAFTKDRQYVVKEGEIFIVDEFTGRISEGRKWRGGIHQAIEAKEAVKVSVESGQAAQVTVQDFFLRYEKLAGMTGTATNSAGELRKIYKVRVMPIPTNRPSIRVNLPDRVFGKTDDKWRAIVEEVREMHATGRPVLIGTRSIDKSDELSRLLDEAGIKHQVLNARYVEAEAEIIAQAGTMGTVTVSTNMAGRGTDIKVPQDVKEIGGLHVICSEMHDSSRIDRQLMGRCGRQGDPGTNRQYLALDDDILLAAYGPKTARKFKAMGEENPGTCDRYAKMFRTAQRKIEGKHFRDRRILMFHERERRKTQLQMGQDPYLDTAG